MNRPNATNCLPQDVNSRKEISGKQKDGEDGKGQRTRKRATAGKSPEEGRLLDDLDDNGSLEDGRLQIPDLPHLELTTLRSKFRAAAGATRAKRPASAAFR